MLFLFLPFLVFLLLYEVIFIVFVPTDLVLDSLIALINFLKEQIESSLIESLLLLSLVLLIFIPNKIFKFESLLLLISKLLYN